MSRNESIKQLLVELAVEVEPEVCDLGRDTPGNEVVHFDQVVVEADLHQLSTPVLINEMLAEGLVLLMRLGALDLMVAALDDAAASPGLEGLEGWQAVEVELLPAGPVEVRDVLAEVAEHVDIPGDVEADGALELVRPRQAHEVLLEATRGSSQLAHEMLLNPLQVVGVREHPVGVVELLGEKRGWLPAEVSGVPRPDQVSTA